MSETDGPDSDRIRALLDGEGDQIKANTRHFNAERYDAVEGVGQEAYEAYRSRAREIKQDAIQQLPTLIERTKRAVETNDGTVYVADDAADARQYVSTVAAEEGAETLVKSKSMTTKEIDLNKRLHADGIDVWETDLGEFVIQITEESLSHIVGPSLHKSRKRSQSCSRQSSTRTGRWTPPRRSPTSPGTSSASGSPTRTSGSRGRTSSSPRADRSSS